MYLLDTNVISELRKNRPHGAVLTWFSATPASLLYVSAVTMGEIQAGIERTRDNDAAKAGEMERWLERMVFKFQVCAADARIFRRWAVLMHKRELHRIPDTLIAATALEHGFTVVTRNTRDFAAFGVPLLNPFELA